MRKFCLLRVALIGLLRVFVTAFDDADCGPLVRVLDSTGELQAPLRGACLDRGPIELTGTPPFSIEIIGDSAGTYHFAVSEVAGDSVTAVGRGQNVDLEVSTPGQQASATIELAAGERAYVETVEHIDGDLVATGPDGAEIASAFSFVDLGLITAAVDGRYTITIEPDGATTGTQRLVVHEVADDSVVSMQVDDEVDLVVSTPGQRASATIELAVGQRIYVETVENIDGDLVVVGPDGAEITSTFAFRDRGLIEALDDGAHTVTIEADGAATGAQRLMVHRVADDTVIAAELGGEVGLQVSTPGQRASATIELAADEQIYVETGERIAGRVVVTGPAGTGLVSRLTSIDPGLVTATSAGTYTVTVVPEEATTGTQVVVIRRP